MSIRVGEAASAPTFPVAAKELMQNEQLRRNVRNATGIIRNKRATVVGETPDWQQLRDAGHAIKDHTLRHLESYLVQFEENCTRAGGIVHWARDADEANSIAIGIIQAQNETEVIKVKTMTTDEIGMNRALEAAGITPYETDLADLIVQLGNDKPSHIVVPALHRNKMEIRELFMRTMGLSEQTRSRPEDVLPKPPSSICAKNSCACLWRSAARISRWPKPDPSGLCNRKATAACAFPSRACSSA